MKSSGIAMSALVLAVAACGPKAKQAPENSVQQAAPAPAAAAAGEQPEAKPPILSETASPIDPKSVEAAGQVVQHYGALIERSRWLKAEKLWGDINLARDFAEDLSKRFGEVHLEIGELGDTEGAAGSIYTTVPVVFYGQSKKGRAVRAPATITLRRVNDVPGATERQRRWHIERIDWKTRT